VTFNDHEASTKSYAYARAHFHPVMHTDFVPPSEAIKVAYDEGEVMPVELHDGSRLLLHKVDRDYNPGNRGAAIDFLRAHQRRGEFVTGLLYVEESAADFHGLNATTAVPLNELEFATLCPGQAGLDGLLGRFR
jgi:2-oxoglutarate ferredoxin oxidoreductase subunit beta